MLCGAQFLCILCLLFSVGQGAGLALVAGALPDLAAVLAPEAVNPTPDPEAVAVASHVPLVDLLSLKRARNALLRVDPSLQLQ